MAEVESDRPICDVCHEPITLGQSWIRHMRLDANVHMSCPMTDVKGEDISKHAVIWHPAPEVERA